MPVVTPPPDMLREVRSRAGVVFERPRQRTDPEGHQRFQWVGSAGALYVPSSVRAWQRGEAITWEEPDTVIRDRGADYTLGNAYYRLSIPKGAIGFRYESRTEGFPFAEITLTHVDDLPVLVVPRPELDGPRIWWRNVRPGLDVYLLLSLDRVDLRKRLLSPLAPTAYRYTIRRTDPMPIRIEHQTIGHDNYDLSDPTRAPLGPGRTRRRLELTHRVGPLDQRVPGEAQYTLTETWTGRTLYRVPETESFEPRLDVVFPLEIDVLVDEIIAANGDDGHQSSTSTWNNSYGATNNLIVYGTSGRPGWRFTTVAIPNAATIDDATFKVERVSGSGSRSGTLYGSAEDNAPAWASGSVYPTNRTKTTAGVAVTWSGTDGTDISLNVKAIIEEITVRAGWASNNALSLLHTDTTGSGWQYLEDAADTDPGRGRLTVNYTAAGGGGTTYPGADGLGAW